MTLRQSVVDRIALSADERARMLALMQLCYENVDADQFAKDLDGKSHVIVMRDRSGVLMGFSTIRMADDTVNGKRVQVMFSGDTVIHPDHWGSKALQKGFLAFTMSQRFKHPRTPLYWLLLSKGYRTYLLLTNNFVNAFPRRGFTPAPELVALRDRIARDWWGDRYDGQGVVRIGQDRVKAGIAPVDTAVLENPDVGFFLQQNPGHANGDELVCLAEVDFALAWRFGWKQLRRMFNAQPKGVRAQT